MARVTVEDCINKVENRFELVALAAQRSKDIASGVPITVERDNDKDSVIALREIANENINPDGLREELIKRLQTRSKVDQLDDEVIETNELSTSSDFEYVTDGTDFYVEDSVEDLYEDSSFEDGDIDLKDRDF